MATVLNPFVQEIEDRKKREISILDSKLDEKREEILKTKMESIKELEERYDNEAQVKSQRESARIREAARLKAKKIVFDAINANMNSTFATVRTELKNYTKKAEYKKTLEKMLNFARQHLGNDVVVRCRNEDVNLIKDSLQLGKPISTIGGIIVSNKDDTKEIDLTFEELFRSHEDEIKSFLLDKTVT